MRTPRIALLASVALLATAATAHAQDASTTAETPTAAPMAGSMIAVAGGGDTVAAVGHAGVSADLTFVSTAGGAFLEWMEGKPLPGVEALRA